MEKNLLTSAVKKLSEQKKKRRWYQIVSVLAVVVVFCTTYALILPAITMERKAYCGMEEHVHDDSCYTEEKTLICGMEEGEGHIHTDACMHEERELVCGLEESEEHVHENGCYETELRLICELEETGGHVHVDSCYDESGKLICGKEETDGHRHGDGCYEEEKILACSVAENGGHTHTEACYSVKSEPACGMEEQDAHTHTDECYRTERVLTCGKEEHTHTDECYETESGAAETESSEMETTEAETESETETETETEIETETETETETEEAREGRESREDWERSMESVMLTGDWAADLVEIAKSQIGYEEKREEPADSESGTAKRYTRYGDWYGEPYGEWNSLFTAFCLHYAGVEDMPQDADCAKWEQELSEEKCGLWHAAGAYTPKVGDLIFFDTDEEEGSDRVGIVAEPSADGLLVIEGDVDGSVQMLEYEPDDFRIRGYGMLPEKDGGEKKELSFEGADYTVRVTYGADARLPENVVLAVSEIEPDSEAYYSYYSQAIEALEKDGDSSPGTLVFARFFDIQFLADEQKIEPEAPVSVTITYASLEEAEEPAGYQAIHFAEDGTELLEVETEQGEDGEASFTHVQGSFSVVGDLVTVTYTGNNADNGPSVLPVDYYVNIDGEWVCAGSTKTGWYGDYTTAEWTDSNRDYITVAQAESILADYGFEEDGSTNYAKQLAYQQKAGNANIYADTNTVEVNGQRIVPLSRNGDHPGYNLYYLPGNFGEFSNITAPEGLEQYLAGGHFYTVKVYDGEGKLLEEQVVRENDSFTYDASASGVTSWRIVSSDTTETYSGSNIAIEHVTGTTKISPVKGGEAVEHNVTFKVCIDGEWQEVGTLPYYYTGAVNGVQRAYITSDMAAQFFGDFGYSAAEAPGYHFGYSYDDIYEIYYARSDGTVTAFCMDVNGANIQENERVQVYEHNGTDAQIFRIWEAEAGYSYITPFGDSGLHVNVLGGGAENGTKLALHSATDSSSRWRIRDEGNDTVSFWSKNEPDSVCIDLDSGNAANGVQLQIWDRGANRHWRLVQQYRVSNNTVSEPISDGTYKIGLTEESTGDIVCYYMPGEETHSFTNLAENGNELTVKNGFWSITVRDDKNVVYSEGELSGMRQVVRDGSDAEKITLKNGDGFSWSCVGKGEDGREVEAEELQEGGYTSFLLKNVTQPVEITVSKLNPAFTVQYYVVVPRYAESGDVSLTVIDTSAAANGGSARLPWNGGNMPKKYLYLEQSGENTTENNGVKTPLYRVKTVQTPTKVYEDEHFEYQKSPGLSYFNKLAHNTNYKLTWIGILKEGRDPASTNDDDWEWHSCTDGIDFTNQASEANANTILIEDNAVLRLRYEPVASTYVNGMTLYDYDISSGQNPDGRWRTGITGINSESNYGTSLNGQTTWRSGRDILAFGNANTGTGMSGYPFAGGLLNRYNSVNADYGGATFGLAAGLNADGTIRYNEWIVAPNLFNEKGGATGKYTYNNGTLKFNQVGDTYTLTSASHNETGSATQLEYFFNPSPDTGTTHTHIFTNNFWPMDKVLSEKRTDPLMGKDGDPGSYQGFEESNNNAWSDKAADFAVSDDGRAHNCYFGMHFAVSFNLTSDYVGPLEYCFFGDDDMWVFLDGKLVCDIGGVHSSLGEYVNLWDYLERGDSGRHTLTFFYTERGGQGSTCYMSFTVPSVSSASTAQDTGGLAITKTVSGTDGVDYSGEEFKFRVDLLTEENGTPLSQVFSCASSDQHYGTIKSGSEIKLHAGETVTISGIPTGTYYRVTELSTQGYQTKVNNTDGYITSGTIENGQTKPASFVNTPFYELPQTGGNGSLLYRLCGVILTAGALMYYRNRRRKGASVY